MRPLRVAILAVVGLGIPGIVGCGAILGVDFDDAHPAREAGGSERSDGVDTSPRPPRFCETISPAPYFCADFEGEDVRDGWGTPGLTPDLTDTAGAKTERVALDSDSPPELGHFAARFSSPALLTRDKLATAYLSKPLPQVRDFAINFKMRIVSEQFEPGGRVMLFEIASGDGDLATQNVAGTLLINRTAGGVTQSDIFEGGVGGAWLSHDEFQPFPVNTWRNIQLVTGNRSRRGDAGTTEIIVRMDNEIQSRRWPTDDLFMAHPLSLLVGIVAITGPSDIFRVELDNIRVDLTPAR